MVEGEGLDELVATEEREDVAEAVADEDADAVAERVQLAPTQFGPCGCALPRSSRASSPRRERRGSITMPCAYSCGTR